MRRRTSTFLTILVAALLVTATPAEAATTAVGSVHTTTADFQSAETLDGIAVKSDHIELPTTQTIDGFEDGDLSEWTTGGATVTSTRAEEGANSVKLDVLLDEPTDDRIVSTTGLPTYPSAGDTFRYHAYFTDGSGLTTRFATQSETDPPNGYFIALNNGIPAITLGKRTAGGSQDLDQTSVTIPEDEWVEVTVDWGPSGTIVVELRDADGNLVGTASATDTTFSAGGIHHGAFGYGGGDTIHIDNQTIVGGPGTGTYVSANHSVGDASQGWTNLSLQNAEATVTWQGWTGTQWTDVSSATYTTTGNYTQALSGGYEKWRVNATFVKTGSDATAQLHDEGVVFDNREPTTDAASATPSGGTTISTSDPTLSIDVSDPTFGTPQSDSLSVSFYADGQLAGTTTASSNGTVSQSVSGLDGGSHSWYAVVEDAYGGQSTSQTFSFNTPSELQIRNESNPTELINNVETSLRFYYSDEPIRIENKSTPDGTVPFTDLPTDREFVLVADAPGYLPRRIYVDSLIETQRVYLLPEDRTHVQPRFRLRDLSGQFPDDVTVMEIQRAINGSWRTVEGDYFGASGSFPANLRYNVRHRLVLLNTESGERKVVGPYTPIADAEEVVTVKTTGEIVLNTGGPQVRLSPTLRSLPAADGTPVVARVDANGENVTQWDLTATYRNESVTAQLAQASSTQRSTTIEETLGLDGRAGGNVTVRVEWTLADGSTGSKRVVYAVTADYDNQFGLLQVLGSVGTRLPAQHLSVFQHAVAMLVSVIAAVSVAGLSRTISTEVVGLTALGSLSAFAVIGWVGYGPVMVGGVAWVAMAGLRRGI